jgi:3-hydroxyacyl-[acyl-carrier-protein] dehydratase
MPTDPRSLGLPHREPFVFIDEVVSLEAGESAHCAKTFAPETDFFRGHFPGDPIVPGVILTEALAQAAGIAGGAGDPGVRYLLSGVRLMKFPAAARPGERVDLTAKKVGGMAGLLNFEVEARVGATTVAQGQIILSQR